VPGWQGRAVFPESRQIGTGSGSFVVSNAGGWKDPRQEEQRLSAPIRPKDFGNLGNASGEHDHGEWEWVSTLTVINFFNKQAEGDDEPGRTDFSGQSEAPAKVRQPEPIHVRQAPRSGAGASYVQVLSPPFVQQFGKRAGGPRTQAALIAGWWRRSVLAFMKLVAGAELPQEDIPRRRRHPTLPPSRDNRGRPQEARETRT
jgi:hypothetical protein